MRKAIFAIVLAVVCALPAWSQVQEDIAGKVKPATAAPLGACTQRTQIRMYANKVYICPQSGAATWTEIGAPAGVVTGPGSATDNAVVRWDGTTGALTQNSVVLIGDTGNITGVGTLASGAQTITSAANPCFAVGPNGATNPTLAVKCSNATQVTGVIVEGQATGGNVSITATDSGLNAHLILIGKGTGGVAIGASDVVLQHDAANALAQRNSTNAQSFRIYNTYTDASNYERLEIQAASSQFFVSTRGAGTGIGRDLNIGTEGLGSLILRTSSTSRWTVSNSGHFLAATDNTYDIGQSGATRPRNAYVGTDVVIGGILNFSGSPRIRLASNGDIVAPSNGVWTFRDDSGASFGRLQFGGTSSSFPSIKRNGAGLDVRLADDSGYAAITAGTGSFNGLVTGTSDFRAGSANYFYWQSRAQMSSPADGQILLQNLAATDFSRLMFGGATSSFPALKRSSTALETKLADDSAYAEHRALTFSVNNACVIRSGAGSPESAVTGNVCDIYLRTDGGAATTLYVKESGSGNTGWVGK